MMAVGRFPYDVSKSGADLIAFSYFQTYATPVAITRCGNLFGGGDLNFNRLVPGTIRSALRDEPPVIRSDGSFIRDYFYARDAVNANLQLAERLLDDGVLGQAFNFGTEQPLSVIKLVDLILRLCDKTKLQPRVHEASHEIPKQHLDCSKVRTRLDWQPNCSLEDRIQETISSYRKHFSS